MAAARRTEEERIQALEAQIESLKRRKVQKLVRRDPALKQMHAAVRSIDKALAATTDHAMREALNEAEATLIACLELVGGAPKQGKSVLIPQPKRAAVSEEALLAYVRLHPDARGELIAQALGTDTATVRPVMKRLIQSGRVKAAGKARATSYSAV